MNPRDTWRYFSFDVAAKVFPLMSRKRFSLHGEYFTSFVISCVVSFMVLHFLMVSLAARLKEWPYQCVKSALGFSSWICFATPLLIPDMLLAPS